MPVTRFLWFVLVCLPITARALTFTAADRGIVVDAGVTGQFTVYYPSLVDAAGKETHKVAQKSVHAKSATISYEGGATLDAAVTDAGEITYTFGNLPADATHWRVQTILPLTLSQGGRWKIGAAEQPFPAALPDNAHLFQGQGAGVEISDAQGTRIALDAPAYSYLEMVDNRAWRWPVFMYVFTAPFHPGQLTARIKVHGTAPATATAALVDGLGQLKSTDWPDKVKSVEELKADVPSEKEYYASLHPPAGDEYGGWPDSMGKLGLRATGYFHVEKKAGRWYLVDPAGNCFFHLGVCVVCPTDDYTTVAGREAVYDWLPPHEGEFKSAYKSDSAGIFSFHLANMIRKYGEPYTEDSLTRRCIERFKKWGFNSVGAFSPAPPSVQQTRTPYVSSLPLGPWDAHIPQLPGIAGTWDPFDETNARKVDEAFAAALPGRANDPLLIGYFLSNEPLYEDIPKVVPSLDGKHACKRALVASLQRKYSTVAAFDAAWELTAKSFDELADSPLVARTRAASDDVHDFTGQFFETYYKLVSETCHKYDRHHLLLGSRLQPGTINNEQLCRAAGRYMDIMSFNYYTNAIDPEFLGRVQGWCGLPMILSEFYFSSPRDSGLLGGFEVASQTERGLGYRQYVEQAAAQGYVIGIEWFTMIDQASTGRWFEKFNGERANTGLLSVTDRPWKPMLAEMMKTNYGIYGVATGSQKPFVWDDPRFRVASGTRRTADAPRAKGPITLDGTATNWPGIPPNLIPGGRLAVGSEAAGFEGSFRVCWDEANLYLLVSVKDSTPLKNENPLARLWSADAVELFIGTEKPAEGGPMQFLDRHLVVGAGAAGAAPHYYAGAVEQSPCEARVFPASDGYAVEVAVPWKTLGATPHPGQNILLDVGLDDSADGKNRRAQLMWSGGAKNSSDRTHWGVARLLD